MLLAQKFKKILSITNLSATSTAANALVGGMNCTILLLTGNLYVDPTGTATVAGSLKVPTGYPGINIRVLGNLSYISDTTATGQLIIYED